MASLNSSDRLNLIITPAAFRSLGDLYGFARLVSTLPESARRSMPAGFKRGLMKALAVSREKMSTLYRQALRPSQSLNAHLAPDSLDLALTTTIKHTSDELPNLSSPCQALV